MKPTLKALRAITSQYLQNLLKPIALVGGIVLGLLIVLTVTLAYFVNAWWLLFLFIIVPVAAVAMAVFSIVWIATEHLRPKKMSNDERVAVQDFTSKTTDIVESIGGQWPSTVVTVARDVLRDRESKELTDVISKSASLHDDFVSLQQLFNQPRGSAKKP